MADSVENSPSAPVPWKLALPVKWSSERSVTPRVPKGRIQRPSSRSIRPPISSIGLNATSVLATGRMSRLKPGAPVSE